MQMAPHVQSIQSDLAAAASLGDDAIAEAGRRLSEAVESSLQLRLLDLLNQVAAEISSQLPSGHIELRLAGRDPELVFVEEQHAEPAAQAGPGDDGLAARITLRLPESLKVSVELAAGSEGVSTNSWLVRAITRALEPRGPARGHSTNRLQGWAQS